MAKRIYDNENYDGNIDSRESQWYRIKFEKGGRANFYLSPGKKTVDLDLFICTAEDKNSTIKSSVNATGEDETILNFKVEAGIYYYILVKNYSKVSSGFLLRVKNYSGEDEGETKAAEIAKSMPLTKAFDLQEDIPSNLSTDYELVKKNVMAGPIKIDFSAGICSNPSARNYSLNFANPKPFLINGTTYSFASEEVTNLPVLGEAIEKFLNRRGFEDITFSMGNVTLYADGTFTISAFQLQDSHALGSGKYVYTRLDCSRDIDLNNFKAFLDFCVATYGREFAYAVAITVGIALAAFLVNPATASVVGSLALVGLCNKVLSISANYLNTGIVL